MAHTPGPWKADKRNWRNEPVEHDIYVTGDEHESYEEDDDGTELPCGTVATSVAIVVGNRSSAEITLANGRLIVAAPTMLKALESVPLRRDDEDFKSYHWRVYHWWEDVVKPAVKLAKEGQP